MTTPEWLDKLLEKPFHTLLSRRFYDDANSVQLVQKELRKMNDDTARADAAEQLLAGVVRSLECHDLNLLGSVIAIENPRLPAWWTDWQAKHDRVRRIADLTARRDRERATLAATERELEELTR